MINLHSSTMFLLKTILLVLLSFVFFYMGYYSALLSEDDRQVIEEVNLWRKSTNGLFLIIHDHSDYILQQDGCFYHPPQLSQQPRDFLMVESKNKDLIKKLCYSIPKHIDEFLMKEKFGIKDDK